MLMTFTIILKKHTYISMMDGKSKLVPSFPLKSMPPSRLPTQIHKFYRAIYQVITFTFINYTTQENTT